MSIPRSSNLTIMLCNCGKEFFVNFFNFNVYTSSQQQYLVRIINQEYRAISKLINEINLEIANTALAKQTSVTGNV